MTGMLASVVDSWELESALTAGADIIDLKNPHTGALGALPAETLRDLVTRCAGRAPVSATVGDLPADPALLTEAIRKTAACGVDYVKLGFFYNHGLRECLQAIAGLSRRHALVAVLFADLEPPLQRLSEFAAAGFRGVMLDTAGKGGGGLLEQISPFRLKRFIDQARELGMMSGLAGSLGLEAIPQLLPLAPDYLGFRGALCQQGERTSGIDPECLRRVRAAVSLPPSTLGGQRHEPRATAGS